MQIEVYPLKDKQKQILELLKFDTVMIFVDARRDGVKVPSSFKAQFDLRLNFDYEFGIEDFRVLPDRLEATLSFAEGEFFCVVPFDAVYLILCHAVSRGGLFPESVPNEMLNFFFDPKKQNLPDEARRPFKVIESMDIENNTESAKTKKPARKKKVSAKKDDAASEPAATESEKPAVKKNHLRLVK